MQNNQIRLRTPWQATSSSLGAALIRISLLSMLVLAWFSPNPAHIVASGITLIILLVLLWRADDLPILLLPALFQWSEVAVLPMSTVWRQVELNALSPYGANLEFSAFYGLIGVLLFAVGLRLGSSFRSEKNFISRLTRDVSISDKKIITRLGITLVILGHLFDYVSGSIGGFRQLFANGENVKCVGVFIITYWCMTKKRDYSLMVIVVGFEVFAGLLGFFADFKNAILTFFIAVLAARPQLRIGNLISAVFAATFLLTVAAFWSAIKPEYRFYLNEGTGTQSVKVSVGDRAVYIIGQISNFNFDKLSNGFDALIDRHGYIEFLGLVMAYVPEVIPHENGKLTLDVVSHILMPRFLFPEKPPLPSDTEVMKTYTGLNYNWDENTSISIGYLGELYIDFGYVGGLIATLLIGVFSGLTYQFVRDRPQFNALVSAGFCTMVVLPLAYFGTAYIKLIGGFCVTAIAAMLLQSFMAKLALPNQKSARI